jgi:hypothetical protein
MRNFLPGGPEFLCRGPISLAPVVSHYSCGAAAEILVCPEYFISPVPSPYIGDEHSPISHLGRHPMGDRQIHTGFRLYVYIYMRLQTVGECNRMLKYNIINSNTSRAYWRPSTTHQTLNSPFETPRRSRRSR